MRELALGALAALTLLEERAQDGLGVAAWRGDRKGRLSGQVKSEEGGRQLLFFFLFFSDVFPLILLFYIGYICSSFCISFFSVLFVSLVFYFSCSFSYHLYFHHSIFFYFILYSFIYIFFFCHALL